MSVRTRYRMSNRAMNAKLALIAKKRAWIRPLQPSRPLPSWHRRSGVQPVEELLEQHRAFGSAEVSFAACREHVGHRHPLTALDELVDVHGFPVEPLRERAGHRRFARAHEAHQIHLVGSHWT